MSYQRIRLEKREEIFRLRYLERLTMRQIGEKLGKDKSSISRELKRGTKNRIYNPLTREAHKRNMRKLQCPKLKMTDEIWEPAKPKLEKRWPPSEIAEWLEREYNYKMSAGTIYNYLHFHMKGELKKLALSELRLKGKKRRGESGEKTEKRGKIPEMTLIDERPAEVEERAVPGALGRGFDNREGA
jgi:IS30 family transposase